MPFALINGCTDAGNEWKELARDGLDSQKHTVGCTSLGDGLGFQASIFGCPEVNKFSVS